FVVESGGAGEWQAPGAPLDCGNSGTTMRLMTGILAGAGLPCELIGDESLSKRPMGRICEPLRTMGAQVRGEMRGSKECAPVRVSGGGFLGGSYTSPVASAQIKSALLLAGVLGKKPVEVV